MSGVVAQQLSGFHTVPWRYSDETVRMVSGLRTNAASGIDGVTKEQYAEQLPKNLHQLVQAGLVKILQAIYEQDFIDDSYGFRPGRGCHDALRALSQTVENQPVNYLVEADIRGFFDNVDQDPNGTYLSPFFYLIYAQAIEFTWKDGRQDDRLVARKHPTIIRSHQPS